MKKPKLMVIGLDSVSLTLLDAFKDSCPNIRRLMRRGTTGRVLPSFPIYTPTNWAALSTGADPTTTGAPGWYNNHAGKRLSTFDRRAIKCDTIFDAAARAGLKTLAVAYPSAHPTKSSANMVLAPLDRGLVSNCLVPGKILPARFSREGVFPLVLLEAPKAASGAALARAVGATEDGGDYSAKQRTVSARRIPAWVFRTGKAAWRLGFSPDIKQASIPLRHEAWSRPIGVNVAIPGRPGRCVLRVMIFDGGRRLAVSEAYDIGMLGCPAKLARDVYEKLGPPTEHSVFYNEMKNLFREGREDKTISRLARRDLTAQVQWIIDAAAMVQRTAGFDLFYLHHHYPDSVIHQYLQAASGSKAFTPKQHALARQALRLCFSICDKLAGGLAALAGARTTILVVSDHGNVPNRYACSISRRLVETHLMVTNKTGSVDRRRSVAWPSRKDTATMGTWIDVSARPGTARYEQLQQKVIGALLDWKAPDGQRVVALALRGKDSHLLGYYGDRTCADVTFHYNSGFAWAAPKNPNLSVEKDMTGSNHGPQMPVTFGRIADNLAFYVLVGPGVRAGRRWDEKTRGYIRMEDLVPTICHVSGVPAPTGITGAMRRELLA